MHQDMVPMEKKMVIDMVIFNPNILVYCFRGINNICHNFLYFFLVF